MLAILYKPGLPLLGGMLCFRHRLIWPHFSMPLGCLHLKTAGTLRNGLSSAPGTSCFMSEHLYIHKNEHLPSSKRERNAMNTDHKAESEASFPGNMIIKRYSKLPEENVLEQGEAPNG